MLFIYFFLGKKDGTFLVSLKFFKKHAFKSEKTTFIIPHFAFSLKGHAHSLFCITQKPVQNPQSITWATDPNFQEVHLKVNQNNIWKIPHPTKITKLIHGKRATWEIEGWHEAAYLAASWTEGPDPASSIEIELSLPKDSAATTALKDWALTEPPSCSPKTSVLIYSGRKEGAMRRKIYKYMQVDDIRKMKQKTLSIKTNLRSLFYNRRTSFLR